MLEHLLIGGLETSNVLLPQGRKHIPNLRTLCAERFVPK